MIRRHLGFTIDEWQALPWWQQRLYMEGFAEEQPWRAPGDAAAGDGTAGSPAGGAGGPASNTPARQPMSGRIDATTTPAELMDAGFNVDVL